MTSEKTAASLTYVQQDDAVEARGLERAQRVRHARLPGAGGHPRVRRALPRRVRAAHAEARGAIARGPDRRAVDDELLVRVIALVRRVAAVHVEVRARPAVDVEAVARATVGSARLVRGGRRDDDLAFRIYIKLQRSLRRAQNVEFYGRPIGAGGSEYHIERAQRSRKAGRTSCSTRRDQKMTSLSSAGFTSKNADRGPPGR